MKYEWDPPKKGSQFERGFPVKRAVPWIWLSRVEVLAQNTSALKSNMEMETTQNEVPKAPT